MTSKTLMILPNSVHRQLWKHLLPPAPVSEEVAFVYVKQRIEDETLYLDYINWDPVLPTDFVTRSEYHLQLSDEARASVIKRAHDLNASLVEFHSHLGSWPAQFSSSDFEGFDEFVPHVLWRLKQRPYIAVVVAQSGFDGLVWKENVNAFQRLNGIMVDGQLFKSSGLSKRMSHYDK